MGGFVVASIECPGCIKYKRHWLVLRDGVEVAIDELAPANNNSVAPVLICFHGIGGSS